MDEDAAMTARIRSAALSCDHWYGSRRYVRLLDHLSVRHVVVLFLYECIIISSNVFHHLVGASLFFFAPHRC